MQNKRNKIQQWLNSKVNDEYILTKYDNNNNTIGYPKNEINDIYYFYKYYTEDDQDVKNSYPYDIDNKFIEKYKKGILPINYIQNIDSDFDINKYSNMIDSIDIYIPQHSNRYHTNYLFKQLINYSDKNELFYELPNTLDETKLDLLKLIDTDMKDKFYEFCYKFTTHKNS